MKRWLIPVLKLAISILLIGLLLRMVDLQTAWSKLVGVDRGLVLLAAVVLSFQVVVGALRWRAVLRAMDASISFFEAIRLLYIGAFFSQVLPSAVGGDLVRIYTIRKSGLSLSAAVNGVMLERLATVQGLVLLVALCQPFLAHRIGNMFPASLAVALVIAGAVGTVVIMSLDRLLPSFMSRWRWARGLAFLAADCRQVFLAPWRAAYILATGIVGHVNISVGVWILGLSLGLGDRLGLLECFLLIPPVILLTTLPISLAGWGVREGGMVVALGLVGLPSESALILSILVGLVLAAIALPGGLMWLIKPNRPALDQEDAGDTSPRA